MLKEGLFENTTRAQSTALKKISINNLLLKSYRNFDYRDFNFEGQSTLIVGPNGSGKTNILESISLLFPGRGLRKAKFSDICANLHGKQNSTWEINSRIENYFGSVKLDCKYEKERDGNKREVFFNGTKINSNELSHLTSIVWLTPQMDYIFLAQNSERRKFFDRIVYNFDAEHSSRVNKYEYYLRERMLALQNNASLKILSGFEQKLAEISVSIAFARLQTLYFLQKSINDFNSCFPKAKLELSGIVEDDAKNLAALNLEKLIVENLEKYREVDYKTSKSNFGVHKTDFLVTHPHDNKPAELCSTGEQKALLISIILAEIHAKTVWTNNLPIILLDEITVHLDQTHSDFLLEHLKSTGIQYIITATEDTKLTKYFQKGMTISL